MNHTRAQRLWLFCLCMDHERPNLDNDARERWISFYLKKQLDRKQERDFHRWVEELASREAAHA